MKPRESHSEEVDPVTRSTSHHEGTGLTDEDQGLHSIESIREDVAEFTRRYDLIHDRLLFAKAATLLQDDVPLSAIRGITEYELAALANETHHKWKQPKLMYLTIAMTALGATGQGWAQTGMNGANLYFPQAFGIDSKTPRNALILGLINCCIYFSNCFLGSWLVAPLNNRLGRRGAVFTAAIISVVSNVGGALTQNWQQLLFFRLLLGCGLAIISSTLNVYAAECAPALIRGGLGVSWQMACAFGIFVGFVFNVAVDGLGPVKWRYELAAPAVPAIPLLALIYLCPESPSWHIKHSDNQYAAFQSLKILRNTELQAARELYGAYLQQRLGRNKEKSSYIRSIAELFTVPRIRRATLAAYTTMISQQLCGINIIAFYSSTIFAESGFSQFAALIASTVFGFVNFVMALPAIWTMDTLGRRSLLLLTLPPMAVTMAIAGGSFSISESDGTLRIGMLACMIYLFCALYSPGMGPVPAAYSAEVFPLSHREVGTASAIAVTNFFAAMLSLTFPLLLTQLGSQGSFLLYATLNVLAFMLVFLFVPETKAKTLEELDDVFQIPTRYFMRYQVLEYMPWWFQHYIFRKTDSELKPLDSRYSAEYRALDQDENADGDRQ